MLKEVEAAAALLDGCEYRKEGSPQIFKTLKELGIVAVFGASDDLMEFRGAVDEELGAPGHAYFTKNGLLENKCDDDDCPYYAEIRASAAVVTAKESADCQFRYETKIPHIEFAVMEDGELYCMGIVFALSDVEA